VLDDNDTHASARAANGVPNLAPHGGRLQGLRPFRPDKTWGQAPMIPQESCRQGGPWYGRRCQALRTGVSGVLRRTSFPGSRSRGREAERRKPGIRGSEPQWMNSSGEASLFSRGSGHKARPQRDLEGFLRSRFPSLSMCRSSMSRQCSDSGTAGRLEAPPTRTPPVREPPLSRPSA